MSTGTPRAGHVDARGHTVSTSAVPPLRGLPIGGQAHQRAVERLRRSYDAVPAGSPVRLAKRTSNLFRPRAAATSPGLDVSGLTSVISMSTGDERATADVQGMCSYEQLVATTLPAGYLPLVVPQLRTITLGGAVTGLGIEATSFRNGLPHESVLELDILTGSGEIVTASPAGEHAELFRTFPNSFGSLGYATRLRIELEPVHPYVALRNVRFERLADLVATVDSIMACREHGGEPVDFLDGVVFAPDEAYLVLGRWADDAPAEGLSDYTGQQIYYRSLQRRETDALTVHDYLWRWDTDWFWCSRAFGAQHPVLRRVWPTARRRSDVYHRIVGLENRYGGAAGIDRVRGRPARERVVQDVEIPTARTAEFLSWFDAHVGMRPVWLCPVRLRSERPWSLYPLEPGRGYLNAGFWGTVPIAAGAADGDVNRAVEAAVADHDGHKSLYSDAYYSQEEFWRRYGGVAYQRAKERYDPGDRLTDLYAKVVRRR